MGEIIKKNFVDADKLIIPASDDQGHGVVFRVRLQPRHVRQMQKIVASGKTPFKTSSDIVRCGVERILKWLPTVMDGLTSVSQEAEIIITVLQDSKHAKQFHSVFDEMGRVISEHISRGADGEAAKLVLEVQRHIAKMPDGYWKDEYAKELESRFNNYVKNRPKASYSSFSEE